MAQRRQFWLLKTEPTSYGIDDLSAEPDQTTCWDGVRNYQARNFMRDQMRVDDLALLYHSNADPSAVVGVVRVARLAYPDHTAWDPRDKHFDPKSSPEQPRWYMVDVQLQQRFAEPLSLERLKDVKVLREMELLRKGSRLSVQPVRKKEFDAILKLAGG